MVPFGGRTGSPLPAVTFVRILVDNAVQPLEFCGGVRGVCESHAFVENQWYARHGGNGAYRCIGR
ncbi:hypothetical protein BJY52DRAFT_1309772 [Lactarius psammicola]|nr:hypothetical protein BJY52DRAFT_1309772 [Lactarius psammicola]